MFSSIPTDVELAKQSTDLYWRQCNDLEEKLRELAIDKKSFDALFREFLTLHRMALAMEQSWKNALQAEFDAARAAQQKKPFWRKTR